MQTQLVTITLEKYNNKMTDFINTFKHEFKDNFGITPIVIYNLINTPVSLTDLIALTDEVLNEKYGDVYFGIKHKCRIQPVAEHRQVFYKIARELGFNYVYIAREMKVNHATVIYSANKVTSMLSSNDQVITGIYHTLKQKIESHYEKIIANSKIDNPNSKSNISAL